MLSYINDVSIILQIASTGDHSPHLRGVFFERMLHDPNMMTSPVPA